MKTCIPGILAVCLLCCILTATIPSASAEDTLTRGSGFTVTVAGKPSTVYYLWLTRTFTMSGEPGDQPPVILSNQMNVVQDPSEGPYMIGSYRYNNGNGRTILDDVAPSSSTTPATSYYAQVTTGSDGVAIVGFRTSYATAAQQFSIRAENPRSPGETVYTKLGVPTPKTTQAPVTTAPLVTTAPIPPFPMQGVTINPLSAQKTQGTLTGTPVLPTPPQQTQPDIFLIILAAGAGLWEMRRSR